MMILRSSPASPFGRKVKLAAAILGLDKEIDVQAADTTDANDTLRAQNPLGKIPVLITADGTSIYDSPVILEYLDHLAGGGKIIPADAKARFAALTLEALCDGVLDACLMLVYEARWRPVEKHEAKWVDYQSDKVKRAFDVLEADVPTLDKVPNVGQITLACVLGYQDLRFKGVWRNQYPKLLKWHDAFEAQVPMFGKTRVQP
jgi:glutathione S-transferase